MDNVPKMISTKDLDYLSDMLDWNFTVSKKVYHFTNETNDEDITNEMKKISQMHEQHYNTILKLLK
jgi:hypothetical protein